MTAIILRMKVTYPVRKGHTNLPKKHFQVPRVYTNGDVRPIGASFHVYGTR